MQTGVPRRTPAELEATAVEAYRKRCDGMSYRDIAAAMAGPPHFCGGHTTARRWVELGRTVEAEKGDSNRKRRARREMAADAIDALRVRMSEDAHAGRLDRAAMYRLQLQALTLQVQLLGLRAAPEPAKAKLSISGGSMTGVDPDVLAALAALDPDELLPDGKDPLT